MNGVEHLLPSSQHLPKLGVSACIWRDDRVLLIQRAKPPIGIWAFPGGHVEAGEKLEQAVTRELLEETGMTAVFSSLLGLYDIIGRSPSGVVITHYVIACYLGIAGPEEPVAASDALSAHWVHPERLDQYQLAPRIAEAIRTAAHILKRS